MNPEIRNLIDNQMTSDDHENANNIGEPGSLLPQIVPDNFPNIFSTYLSNVDLHPSSVTASSNVNHVSLGHAQESSHHVTRCKRAPTDQCDEGNYEGIKSDMGQRKQPKRARSSETNGSSERKRRERLKAKMTALKELLPTASSSKSDQASILDQAIRHIKSLQSHLQAVSMGLNPWQLVEPCMAGCGSYRSVETPSSSAPGRLEQGIGGGATDPFSPLSQLVMLHQLSGESTAARPIVPATYLNPHHFLHSDQTGIWVPSTQEALHRQPAFESIMDNLSALPSPAATDLPPTFGSGIIRSELPYPSHHGPPSTFPGPSDFQLVPTIQNQTSLLEDPFPLIQPLPTLPSSFTSIPQSPQNQHQGKC